MLVVGARVYCTGGVLTWAGTVFGTFLGSVDAYDALHGHGLKRSGRSTATSSFEINRRSTTQKWNDMRVLCERAFRSQFRGLSSAVSTRRSVGAGEFRVGAGR